ncbi:hypothetical protein SOVF_042360 [Spinacia oleracea]|uniref:Defensin-like protein n=1 Tax=Spinacia oleracea TaxID=3562 RepID=A0A9R0JZH4_SPIOL|nr:uncharacterized protein LOC110792358 [Spinacia oleracea]KNA21527.1 hypothetical protein SOVF_042360 [Spinacia oleracea]
MARATTSTFFILTIMLVVFLNSSAPAVAVDETCKMTGEFCGGIVGFQCCDGLECILDGDYADAGGECKPTCPVAGEFCGGIAGIQCCKGLTCVLEGDFPDAGGKCTKGTHYKKSRY